MKRFTVVEHHKGYWVIHDKWAHYSGYDFCVFRENGKDNIFDERFNPLNCKPNVRDCKEIHSHAGDTNYEHLVEFCEKINSFDRFTIAEIKSGDEAMLYANTENNPYDLDIKEPMFCVFKDTENYTNDTDVYEQDHGVVQLTNWRNRK